MNDEPASRPDDQAAVSAYAALVLDLSLPAETLAGVAANLAILADHWQRLEPNAIAEQ